MIKFSAEKTRELRDQSGLSVAELALLCGWSRQHQWAIETGKAHPSVRSIIKLTAALGYKNPGVFFIDDHNP